MAVCRFLVIADGMPLVIESGSSYFSALRCSGRAIGLVRQAVRCHGEQCNLWQFIQEVKH